MPLAAGSKIRGYDIVALLGAGGMGEVYRARDKRLGRDVAIKIVSPAIAGNADGLMRFEREARLLAALNHPNIAAIYGVDDHGNQPLLILELVEGETLADRIARGPIPVDEALSYARQIADALDTAHEAGIVHRDLKPGNIKVTESGAVKVLDFGLAKAIAVANATEPAIDPAQSPTVTLKGTQGGVILGTAGYMSPEQARGRAIDKRTDIWAFGCVLYEMLSGRRAFGGETISDVIAAVIERTPDWSQLPASTPPHLRSVVERCLEKDPKRRARDIADVARQLTADAAPVQRRPIPWAIAAMAALVAAVVGFAAARWSAAPGVAAPPVIEFTIAPPPDHTFVTEPSLSPDGRVLAFGARDAEQLASLWIRPIEDATPRRLDGTERIAGAPIWSPDGRELAFVAGDTWKRISADGGPVVTIVSGIVANMGASWGPGDTILMAPANRTWLGRVAAAGGSLAPVTTLDTDKENSHRWPQILPDGNHFLFTARSDRPENLGIKVGRFGSTDVKALVGAPSPGRYVEPGWLLFMTPDTVLMAQRIDPRSLTLSGDPQPLVASVRYNGPSFQGAFDASRDGRVLAYAPASRGQSVLAWFDRTGTPLGTVGPERRFRSVRLSSDGRRAAVELVDDLYGTRDIWLVDVATHALNRLTANSATDWRPIFSPDGQTVAFASDRAGASTVFKVAVDGSSPEEVLYRHPEGGAFPSDWSRDGRRLLVQIEDRRGRRTGFVMVPVDGAPAKTLIDNENGVGATARVSPDGERFAFSSAATGNPEVYVMSLTDGQRVRVSTDGGLNPAWGRDGRELFFHDPRGAILMATFDSASGALRARPVEVMRPCAALNRVFMSLEAEPGFDVASDGTRILARCDAADSLPTAFTVVVNWQSRLQSDRFPRRQ